MNMTQAANLILETALATLARVHGCTIEQVCQGIASGNTKLVAQFRKLAETGAATVVEAL